MLLYIVVNRWVECTQDTLAEDFVHLDPILCLFSSSSWILYECNSVRYTGKVRLFWEWNDYRWLDRSTKQNVLERCLWHDVQDCLLPSVVIVSSQFRDRSKTRQQSWRSDMYTSTLRLRETTVDIVNIRRKLQRIRHRCRRRDVAVAECGRNVGITSRELVRNDVGKESRMMGNCPLVRSETCWKDGGEVILRIIHVCGLTME